jgi:leucyl-tRNA synthetase
VQVRGTVDVSPSIDEAGAVTAAMANANVTKFTEGKAVKKVIFKAGKILNLIVAQL